MHKLFLNNLKFFKNLLSLANLICYILYSIAQDELEKSTVTYILLRNKQNSGLKILSKYLIYFLNKTQSYNPSIIRITKNQPIPN